jgi:hypothetical protein
MMDSSSYLAHKRGKNDAKTITKQGLLLVSTTRKAKAVKDERR